MNKKIENPKITETFIDNFDFFFSTRSKKDERKI